MKHLKLFEESEFDSKEGYYKIDELLKDDIIKHYFIDLIDLEYSYGYKDHRPGYHKGSYIQPKNNIEDSTSFKDGGKILTLDKFTLCFYKLLGTWDKYIYRPVDDYKNILNVVEGSINQYINDDLLDGFEFSGIFISSTGIPIARKLQCVELLFLNKNIDHKPPRNLLGGEISPF